MLSGGGREVRIKDVMAGVRSKGMTGHASCIVRGFLKLLWYCHKDNIHSFIFQLAEISLSESHEIRTTDLVYKACEGPSEDWHYSEAMIILVVIIITYPTFALNPKLTCLNMTTPTNFASFILDFTKTLNKISISNGNSSQKQLQNSITTEDIQNPSSVFRPWQLKCWRKIGM